MRAIENLNIPPFTHNFKQNANVRKFSKPLTFNAHNLKTMLSSCNRRTDLQRAKAEHSFDVIFVSMAKLYNRHKILIVDSPRLNELN